MKRCLLAYLFALAALAQAMAGTISYNTGVQTGTTAVTIGTLPQNCVAYTVMLANQTTNAAGNISIGPAAAPTAIVNAVAVGSSAGASGTQFISVAPTPVNATTYVSLAPVAIQISSSAWGSANLNVSLVYACF